MGMTRNSTAATQSDYCLLNLNQKAPGLPMKMKVFEHCSPYSQWVYRKVVEVIPWIFVEWWPMSWECFWIVVVSLALEYRYHRWLRHHCFCAHRMVALRTMLAISIRCKLVDLVGLTEHKFQKIEEKSFSVEFNSISHQKSFITLSSCTGNCVRCFIRWQ